VENNPLDFGSVLLALLGPLRVDVDKRYYICSTTVMSEMRAILRVKMYAILTAIVSCFFSFVGGGKGVKTNRVFYFNEK
jgi:hypothetical protein